MTRIAFLFALLTAVPLHAATQMLGCTNGGSVYQVIAPGSTATVQVAPTSGGPGPCQLLGVTPAAWFVKVTTNGGGTWTWVTLASLGLGVGAVTAPPAAAVPAAVLTWVAPTTNVNQTPITVPLTYNVYRGSSAAALVKLTSVTGLTYTDPAGSVIPTTYFYAVTATCPTCTESAESAVISVTLAAPALQPSPPTGLSSH